MEHPLVLYLLIVNAAGFVLMLADKHKAKKNKWRVRESTLLGVAIIGGSIGVLAGMYTVRHKTRHKKFSIGVPVIIILQCLLAIYLLMHK